VVNIRESLSMKPFRTPYERYAILHHDPVSVLAHLLCLGTKMRWNDDFVGHWTVIDFWGQFVGYASFSFLLDFPLATATLFAPEM